MKENNKNKFIRDFDKLHPSELVEWWYALGFLNSINDDKKWCFRLSLKEIRRLGGMIYSTTFYDQNENHKYSYEIYINYKREKRDEPLENGYRLNAYDAHITGKLPDYDVRYTDKENQIKVDLKYKAKATPFWIAQYITSGWLPAGLSFFRYGYIPKNDISGKVIFKGKDYKVTGKGYMEHVYGNLLYRKPFSKVSELNKIFSIYSRLISWWMQSQKVGFPRSIGFTTENSPLGYDWAWAYFDNGWSIFYGNLLFWMMEGPATGILYLTREKETNLRFSNITYHYIQTRFSKTFDCIYPTEFEIIARKEKKEMYLHFKMTSEIHETTSHFPKNSYWRGYIILESPGIVEGYYKDGDKRIKLSGIAKIEPQRQISKLGHNSLKLNFILPPKGVGVKFDFNSHFFKKKLKGNVQLKPRLKLKFKS
jgi:hypothetical protein